MARRAKKKMLSGATDYTLLQMKHAHGNQLKEAASYRDRSRVVENYKLASQRNGLEIERMNLNHYLQKLPIPMQQYYSERVRDLASQIDTSKRRFPQYRGWFDE